MKSKKVFDRVTKKLAYKIELSVSEALWLQSGLRSLELTESKGLLNEPEKEVLKALQDQLKIELE